jgi:hypothetical protein
MTGLDLTSIDLAPIIGIGVIALPLLLACRAFLARSAGPRHVWHPAVFEAALYMTILSIVVLA